MHVGKKARLLQRMRPRGATLRGEFGSRAPPRQPEETEQQPPAAQTSGARGVGQGRGQIPATRRLPASRTRARVPARARHVAAGNGGSGVEW